MTNTYKENTTTYKKMVKVCENCEKKTDERLPSKVFRALPKIFPGLILIQILAYLTDPIGLWNNLIYVTNIFSLISFFIIGTAIVFFLVAYDVMGTAGEF